MAKYQFLLFDADHTLLDFDADMTAAFQRLYRHCGFDGTIPYRPELLAVYEKYNNKWWGKFERQECTKPELFRGRFVEFLAETGLSADPDDMNEAYFRYLGEGGALYPGAAELIRTLAQEAEVYIITNGNAASSMARLERSGLLAYTRDVFISEAVGVGKPDPRYFQYVAEHIPGFEQRRAVVIGDSIASDIQGAVNAGLDSIWYRPPGRGGDAQIPEGCTYLAQSYQEILRILL